MTASQLVPVVPGTIGNVQCLTVDGRTLHSVLGVRRVFAAWIQGREARRDNCRLKIAIITWGCHCIICNDIA